MPDRQRPQYHFLAPANWLNDPNGLVQWQGTYHLFYQHNPNFPFWGNIHWGHATSPDLVHWQHQPVALAPAAEGPDESGVWSGCAVNWDGVPTMVYTGRLGESENVCLATSHDGLLTWEKYPQNPVIAGRPDGLDTVGFRDPCVWRDNNRWMMAMGSGFRDVGGAILLYSSDDLVHWQYLGPMLTGDSRQREPVWTGEMWECPNLFPLGDRYALMISPMDLHPARSLYTIVMLGDLRGNQFVPQTLAKMDGGDFYFYAPQAFQDELGRRITIGWAREAHTVGASIEQGWAGVMTLPRLLDLNPGGQLRQRPVPEVEMLRGAERSWQNLSLGAGRGQDSLMALNGLSGDTLELAVEFALEGAGSVLPGAFGLLVRRSPHGQEQTEIRIDRSNGSLSVDTMRSSLSREVEPGHYEIPLDLTGLDRVRLRVFLDRSIIEVFANDIAVVTARIYPTREDSAGIAFFAERQPVTITSLRCWEMTTIW
ncbi:MAG TPA: glycoside hydrolase family 32 protein [Anaerolineaceae bacterium]